MDRTKYNHKKYFPNTLGLEILTAEGFRPFIGIGLTHADYQPIRVSFDDTSYLDCTDDHQLIVINPTKLCGVLELNINVNDLNVGDVVKTTTGTVKIISIERLKHKTDMFEVLEVTDKHQYTTNNVISHNCKFISSDPLLLDTELLAQLDSKIVQPISESMGFRFWKQLKPECRYILGIDPATGIEKDFSVMVLYEYDTLELVCEYRSNTVSSVVLYGAFKYLAKLLLQCKSECTFSVENNGVGEGFISLYESDEEPPDHFDMISEETGNRIGFRTEQRSKLIACLTLKKMIESYVLKPISDIFIHELQSYITRKGSYSAQPGSTDDVISAHLIIVRMLEEMTTYDQLAHDRVHTHTKVSDVTQQFEQSIIPNGVSDDDDEQYDDDYEPDGFII